MSLSKSASDKGVPMHRMLIAAALLLLFGVFGCSREPLVSPTAPQIDSPPDSVERCTTFRVVTDNLENTELSVSRPRVQSTLIIDVPENNTITSTMLIINQAGSDAAVIRFLETLPGRPYARYYFRTAEGDTLFRPNSTNGSTTTFDLSAKGVPAGKYHDVALYKGTIRLAYGAVPIASPSATTWYAGISWTTWVDQTECHMVPIGP